MIRYSFIQNQILNIYAAMPVIRFPLNIKEIVRCLPNCRYMSYQQLAEINQCSVDDIIQTCESRFGCTHYDIANDRYLILCNQSTENHNNLGRQRWTCGHEVGHIICRHYAIPTYEKQFERNPCDLTNPEYELEADYFAATLLAPFPFFELLNIKSVIDAQNVFGLSTEASLYRYKQYLKWLNPKVKTAWENDMVHLYRQKSI